MPKLGNTLDANGNKIVNALMDPRTADPAVLAAGKVWFRSDLKQLSFYDGLTVQRISLTALAGTAPVGQISGFGGAGAPAGWLMCDGSAVSRAGYPDLFAVIGTTFGNGDGSTTFNVPDLRGRSPLGAGTGTGLTTHALAQLGGEESHVLTLPEAPYHGMAAVAVPSTSPTANAVAAAEGSGYNVGGGGGAHNNMQPFLAVNFIIKAMAGNSGSGGAAAKYATALATSATSYVINHNLGTTDVFVSVRDTTTNAEVLVTVEHTDINNVTIRFTNAPAANTRRVVVIG